MHQAHTHTAGIAARVRALGADPYPASMIGAPVKLGSIRTDQPTCDTGITDVVHLYAQKHPGKPRADDTAEMRIEAFRNGLAILADLVHLGTMRPTTFLFPHGIGCGLAGGDWKVYRPMIDEFARSLPRTFKVVIVRLPK